MQSQPQTRATSQKNKNQINPYTTAPSTNRVERDSND